MSKLPASVMKPVAELVNLLGERAVVAALRTLLDNGRAAQLERNKELGKRSYRRGPR